MSLSIPLYRFAPITHQALRAAWEDVRLPFVAGLATIAAALLTQWATGVPLIGLPTFDVAAKAGILLVVFVLYITGTVALLRRLPVPGPAQPFVARLRRLRTGVLSTERVIPAIVSIAVAYMVLVAASIWKRAVGQVVGFGADASLAHLDRTLHGADPWRLLQPWLGHPAITVVLDRLYALWLPLLVPAIAWFCWYPERAERRRFLLAVSLTWIGLAIILALALPSAGPCYYSSVTGDGGPFGDLMAYLGRVNATSGLAALGLQRWLWWAQESGAAIPYASIAAMPSLHVAFPVLCTLAAWQRSRWFAVAWGVFAILTWLGSIHLGWHYAIDGEVAALAVVGIWAATGRYSTLKPGS